MCFHNERSSITRMFQKHDEVVRLDIGFEPEAAVSGPVVLQTDDAVFLTFNAVSVTSDGRRDTAGTGIIEFERSQHFGREFMAS